MSEPVDIGHCSFDNSVLDSVNLFQDCVAVDCATGSASASSEFCATAPVVPWTECSAANCGEEGVMAREMMFVNKQKALMMNCDMSVLKIMKACFKEGCGGGDVAVVDEALAKAKRVCMAPAVTGRCRARIDRIAFDAEKLMCVPFVYGGCGGNDNNFLSEDKCTEVCKPLRDMLLAASGDVDQDEEDEEIDGENELSLINSIIGPRLPLIGESTAGKRLKTYKALDKFDFDDKRDNGVPIGHRAGLKDDEGGNEGVPEKPVVQAEDPNIPIRRPAGEAEAEEAARLEESVKHAKDGAVSNDNESEDDRNGVSLKSNRKKVKAPVDCVVSEWSDWTICRASCGKPGRQVRTKSIITSPSRGGVKCPKKKALRERRKCRVNDADCDDANGGVVDCVLGEWSQWSSCSRSCGGGVARRTRKRVTKPKKGGKPCKATKEKRECNPELCP